MRETTVRIFQSFPGAEKALPVEVEFVEQAEEFSGVLAFFVSDVDQHSLDQLVVGGFGLAAEQKFIDVTFGNRVFLRHVRQKTIVFYFLY